jgi:hypothetical protein
VHLALLGILAQNPNAPRARKNAIDGTLARHPWSSLEATHHLILKGATGGSSNNFCPGTRIPISERCTNWAGYRAALR